MVKLHLAPGEADRDGAIPRGEVCNNRSRFLNPFAAMLVYDSAMPAADPLRSDEARIRVLDLTHGPVPENLRRSDRALG
jgi:hypothetical protein